MSVERKSGRSENVFRKCELHLRVTDIFHLFLLFLSRGLFGDNLLKILFFNIVGNGFYKQIQKLCLIQELW